MKLLDRLEAFGDVIGNLKSNQWFAAARNWASACGGIMVLLGLMSEAQKIPVTDAIGQLFTGIQQIGQGVGTIITAIGILVPAGMSAYAAFTGSNGKQVKYVVNNPEAVKQAAAEPKMVSAVADSPAVIEKVVVTPEMEAAATSANVVAGKV